jgi:iron complex transport system ATP-binding protein
MNTKNSILITEDLCVGYSDLKVVCDINIDIQKGKLICILGKNGSGKSTLIRTMAQMHEELEGFIYINGRDIKTYSKNQLAQIQAVVLTEKLPDSLLTVLDIISLGRHSYTNWLHQLSNEDQKKIDFAIKETHVEKLLNKQFTDLSDGQRQRVMLAKAIAQDTPLILLDEPTAHLDVHFQMESFLLFKELAHKYQKTIIIATHEIGLSIQLSDELWLIDNQSIAVGKPQEMIQSKKLANIFDSDLIHFNPKTSTFEFK